MTHPDQRRTPTPAGRPESGALHDFLLDAASWDPGIEQVLEDAVRDGSGSDQAAAARRVLHERLLTEPGMLYRLVQLLAGAGGLDAGDLPPGTGGPGQDRPVPPGEPPGATIQLTGRETESSVGRRAVTRRASGLGIVGITGQAGVGKTRLAREIVTAIGRERSALRLEVSLSSAAPGIGDRQRATAVHDALHELLTQLGVRAADVPASLEGRRDRYAAELAGRRAVLLIDGAIDESQVLPLLPAGPGSVVVTSRAPLPGLFDWGDGHQLRLGPLSRAAARLLAQRAFLALGIEPQERVLTAVHEWCHGVPGPTILACRLMAVAAEAGGLAVEMLAEQLSAARREGPGPAVLAGLLGEDQQTVMRALGLLQIPEAGIEAVSLATGLDRDRARAALDQLARIGLVSDQGSGQSWGLTPLAASCAEWLALWQVPEEEYEPIIGPVIGLYQMRAENLRDMITASLAESPAPLRAWAEEQWRAEAAGMRAVLSAAADSGRPAQARQLAAAFMDVAAYAEGRQSGWRETEASIAPLLRIASDADEPELAGRATEWLGREARLRGVPDPQPAIWPAVSQPGPQTGPGGDQGAAERVGAAAADVQTPLTWLDDQAPAAGPLLFGAGAGRP
jgi:hypothetical protein